MTPEQVSGPSETLRHDQERGSYERTYSTWKQPRSIPRFMFPLEVAHQLSRVVAPHLDIGATIDTGVSISRSINL